MIGTNIRGIRHLWRVSDYSLKKIFVRCSDHGFDICEVLKTKPTSAMGERMYIFNSFANQTCYSYSNLLTYAEHEGIEGVSSISHPRVVEVTSIEDAARAHNGFNGFFSEIVLLPDTFDKDFENFIASNKKMVNSISEKYCLSTSDMNFKRFYIYTEGSKNFFQWAIDLYYKGHCSMRTIHNILTWNEHYKQLVKNLSKGTITAYTNQNAINNLFEELADLRKEKRINDAINSFNTLQKKLLKKNELSKIDTNTLANFSKLSDAKKNNFIRKVSSIDDFQELMRQMRHVTSIHFEWSKESFMDFIHNVEGINYEIVYENDLVILVKVSDYETIKQLAKTTNWCISKNKTYWNNYIEHQNGRATQYMIFDFSRLEDDKLSIIGFTTTLNKGITSAHNFVNDNLMKEDNSVIFSTLKSYLSKFDEKNNIYNILQKCNIDVTLVAHYDRPQYKWDYDSFMNYLYSCVSKDNVDVIKHEDDKLVLSVRDENIKYFFGDSYLDNISCEDYEEQHIIFADFSINQYNPNKLIFAIIYNGENEDYCNGMYNESSIRTNVNFDSKLIEFGLPYNIIKRVDDVNRKMQTAFMTYNSEMMRECMKKDKKCLNYVLSNYIDTETAFSIIMQSISNYLSFDYLNVIYDNGYTLSNFLVSSQIAELLKRCFEEMKNASRVLYRNGVLEKPNEERINAFYEGKLNDRNDTVYVGNYIIIKEIINREPQNQALYTKLTRSICHSSLRGQVIKEILYMIINRIDMKSKTECSTNMVFFFISNGDEEMISTLKTWGEKYSWIGSILKERQPHCEELEVLTASLA